MTFGRRLVVPRAFTLIELLVVIAILALLVGILLPAIAESRRVGRRAVCESNMKQFGVGAANYATDFQDRIYSFTWKAGTDYGYGGVAATSGLAASNQAWDILRRRTGNEPWFAGTPQNWIPHVLYNHLVLNDYLGQRLPEKMVICPDDRARQRWQEDPYEGYENLGPSERPMPIDANNKRWPFSSSYQIVPAAFSPDQAQGGLTTVGQDTGSDHNQYLVPGTVLLGNRKLGDVNFPSQKVILFDTQARHFSKRQQFYAYTNSRQPLLSFDSSVSTRRTMDANKGFDPNNPISPLPTRVFYKPQAWEPPALFLEAGDRVFGYYQWTRSGLRGVDFGGGEVLARPN